MPADIIPIKRLPRSDDGVQALLAKLLSVQAQRVTGTALASGTRSSTTASSDIDTSGIRGVVVYLFVSVASGTGGLRIGIRGRDPVTNNYMQLALTNTANVGIGNQVAVFGQAVGTTSGASIGASVNGSVGTFLPDLIRIEIQHGDASPYTYSVGYCLVP